MKKILIFSNREQIGDGLIKLPFLHEIRERFPKHYVIWVTNSGSTVFNGIIKRIAYQYIDEIYEEVPLLSFIFRIKSKKYNLKEKFDVIIDTQKAFVRTLSLKCLECKYFISSSSNWIFSDFKPKHKDKFSERYYLHNLYEMLDLISSKKSKKRFNINFPNKLLLKLNKIFDKRKKYIGFAPGSAVYEKRWKLDNYIQVAQHYNKLKYIPTFYLGPLEKKYKKIILKKIPKAIFPEDLIPEFPGPEVVMASTKFLKCSVGNDGGTTQMLSYPDNHKPLIKLVGPTNAIKFTPVRRNFNIINARNYGGTNVNLIPKKDVIKLINKLIN